MSDYPYGYGAPPVGRGRYGGGGFPPPPFGQGYGAPPAQQSLTELTKFAAAAVAAAMGSDCYALIGGAACTLLGSTRMTEDVDFVVPQGQTAAARNKLRNNSAFQVETGTNHTHYVQPGSNAVEIEILAPPGLFKGQFSASTPYVLVNNVRVLKPTLILDAKCGSILGRASEAKKQTDSLDIKFLLAYIAHYGMPVGSEVPNASGEFITWFVKSYGGKELFQKAGFTIPGDDATASRSSAAHTSSQAGSSSAQPTAAGPKNTGWILDQNKKRYYRYVNGKAEWAPEGGSSSSPSAATPQNTGWIMDPTRNRYYRYINGKAEWAPE